MYLTLDILSVFDIDGISILSLFNTFSQYKTHTRKTPYAYNRVVFHDADLL